MGRGRLMSYDSNEIKEEVDRLYDRFRSSHPKLINSLEEKIATAIDAFEEDGAEEFTSREIGGQLLKAEKEFRKLCGKHAARVFGNPLKNVAKSKGYSSSREGDLTIYRKISGS